MTPKVIQERAETIARELLEWAKRYVNARETVKARNSLKLAGEIVPETRRSSEFRELLHKIEEIEQKISQAVKKKWKIKLDQQVREFNRLFEQQELVEAQKALKEIEKRFGKTVTTRKLRKRVERSISREIERRMANGKTFYSREQIEYAINEWAYVLLLDPDNQKALVHISRAMKILKQLHRVRKNQKR